MGVKLIKKDLEKIPNGLKHIISEMCERVGCSEIDLDDNYWYEKYTWTQNEQDDFADWLFNEFKRDKSLIKDFSKNTFNTNERIKKLVDEIIMMWGWKTYIIKP